MDGPNVIVELYMRSLISWCGETLDARTEIVDKFVNKSGEVYLTEHKEVV
jgi:hypothetical protein